MPFISENGRHVLRLSTGSRSCLFVPTLLIGLALVGVVVKNALHYAHLLRGKPRMEVGVMIALGAAGLFMSLVAAAAITGRGSVVVDPRQRLVSTELRLLGWVRRRAHAFSAFRSITVREGQARSTPSSTSQYRFYFAVLEGEGASQGFEHLSYEEALAQAHWLAAIIGVPVVLGEVRR